MLPRRLSLAKGNTVTPVPQDVEQVDVTRLDVLIQGFSSPLSYNLEKDDTYTESEEGLKIQMGERVIVIARQFIVMREVRPAKMNKVRPSSGL